MDRPQECVQRDIPYVLVVVQQESAQYVHGQDLRKNKLFALNVLNKFRHFTLNPPSDLMSMMDNTVSYKMVLPTFLLVSVLVATWARMSFMASEASTSFMPSTRRSFNILT